MSVASPYWWQNPNLQADLPRWWFILDAMTDGRYWTTATLKRRLPWMPPRSITATAVRLWERGHIDRRTNPRYLAGVPHYLQPPGMCPNLLRINATGRAVHAEAKTVAERLAAGELLPIGRGD